MSNEEHFKPGDHVHHRVHGLIRVVSVSGDYHYCTWQDEEGRVQQGTFHRDNLSVGKDDKHTADPNDV